MSGKRQTSEVLRGKAVGGLARIIQSNSDSTWIISGQEWKQGGQRGDHKLTRGMVASTSELVVEVTRSDWALDIRKDV